MKKDEAILGLCSTFSTPMPDRLKLALNTDELASRWFIMFVKPVGINEPDGIIVRPREDVSEKGFLRGHVTTLP